MIRHNRKQFPAGHQIAFQITNVPRQQGFGQYRKEFDQRKRRIRGLWERNGTFYAQITVQDEATGKKLVRRTRMEDENGNPVSTAADAKMAMDKLRVKRDNTGLSREIKRTPTFANFADTYLKHYELVKDAKSPQTIRVEKVCINRHTRLRQITMSLVNGYKEQHQSAKVGPRSINLELIVLRNVMKRAVEDGAYLSRLIPSMGMAVSKPIKRRLLSHDELDRICATALIKKTVDGQERPHYTNGQEFADFVRLMAYSGGRWAETLQLRWADVDLDHRQLHIRGKGQKDRVVDFNDKLEAHLRNMVKRRRPDTAFLFPSPKRGAGDAHATTFNMTLRQVREDAKMPDFTCHLCRHYFISTCVMAGIDYMTIAAWAGHSDGGILIGKVYGHLAKEHKTRMAERLKFAPVGN